LQPGKYGKFFLKFHVDCSEEEFAIKKVDSKLGFTIVKKCLNPKLLELAIHCGNEENIKKDLEEKE